MSRWLTDNGVLFIQSTPHTQHLGGPDIVLPCHRLALWMQRREPSGNVSRAQALCHESLRACGWIVTMPHGADDAVRTITRMQPRVGEQRT